MIFIEIEQLLIIPPMSQKKKTYINDRIPKNT